MRQFPITGDIVGVFALAAGKASSELPRAGNADCRVLTHETRCVRLCSGSPERNDAEGVELTPRKEMPPVKCVGLAATGLSTSGGKVKICLAKLCISPRTYASLCRFVNNYFSCHRSDPVPKSSRDAVLPIKFDAPKAFGIPSSFCRLHHTWGRLFGGRMKKAMQKLNRQVNKLIDLENRHCGSDDGVLLATQAKDKLMVMIRDELRVRDEVIVFWKSKVPHTEIPANMDRPVVMQGRPDFRGDEERTGQCS